MDSKIQEKLEDFLHQKKISKELRQLTASGRKSLMVEYKDLVEFDKHLAEFLLDSPREFIQNADKILEGITKITGSRFRIKSLDKSVDIRHIRSAHLGKFMQMEGILIRASEVRPEIKVAVFRCRRCGETTEREQVGEFLTEPLFCDSPNCPGKGKSSFELVLENTMFRDWQSIRIQEPPAKLRGGRMPRNVDGIIRDDYVDKAVPGNHAVVTGYLHALYPRTLRRGQLDRVFRMVFFVNHIDVLQKGIEETELTEEDEKQIKELGKDPWVTKKIISSIAPAIKGHEDIKEAIALQLFGCDRVELKDGTRIRGDTHLLLTGDPGTAKSQTLKWVSQVSPRGLYTSAIKATRAGLTATAVRDELSGAWTLEAGALAIADGGLASIDEFEKMEPEDRAAVLESMEQQTISVAKAGIVATLNTRTAILAATNPRAGRFDTNIPIPQQLELDPVLLSRFDVIFILRDEPKVDVDRETAKHILHLHTEPSKVLKPPIDVELLRKMIIYARKNVHPTMDDEQVHKKISDFYVNWRNAAVTQGQPIPITIRQLEGLIRLAKSSARFRFSNEVKVEDAERAIKLVEKSLNQIGFDPSKGAVDIDLITTGMPKSQRDHMNRVLDIVRQLQVEYGGAAPIDKVKEKAMSENISEKFVDYIIDKEKDRGTLYSPTHDTVAWVK
jgi:replicative DNA helicase Mcm